MRIKLKLINSNNEKRKREYFIQKSLPTDNSKENVVNKITIKTVEDSNLLWYIAIGKSSWIYLHHLAANGVCSNYRIKLN